MRILDERKQAKQAAVEDSIRKSIENHADLMEHQAQLAIASGDTEAYVDCLEIVEALHNAGSHEKAEALLERIKATLAKPDADEAEAFVASAVTTDKRDLGKDGEAGKAKRGGPK